MIQVLLDYLNEGGGVMYCLLLACFVITHIGVGKLFQFRRYSRKQMVKRIKPIVLPATPQPVFRTVEARDWFHDECHRLSIILPGSSRVVNENIIREVLLYHVPRLESGLDTMAAWVSVAPLLGLLGTVIGMIQTFKMIMLFGVGDPAVMSEGISVSLLTTQAGLLVAFPGLLFLNYLQRKKDALIANLIADYEAVAKSLAE